MSTNDLLGHCYSKAVTKKNLCIGYLMGVSDAVEALDGICLSAGMSSDKAVREFTRYVARHPNTKREAATPVVLRAFKAAWPCPQEPE